MAYRASVLPVMIASPGDVSEQRDDIRSIINNWNFINGYSKRTLLMSVGWETHAAPELSGRAQGIINERLLENCDLLVGVFWTKLGTPTGDFQSGTVEEISRHVDAGKPAMVYFSDAPVAPQSIDAEQYAKVQDFKAWCFERGLVATFTNPAEFRVMFESQLQIQLNSNPYIRGVLDNSERNDPLPAETSELSEEATELLLEASSDSSGYVMTISTMNGQHIQTNGNTFGEPGNARSSAKWEAALEELIALSYLTARGSNGEVFQVTNAGYRRADELRGSTE
ncbi:hypothetical protein RCO27_18035 [Sphingosinicella sp. LHD-64]|uniref:hypothetical protein n=1 Tax=Sphingosinicella sp. LHD-64 TaxID=3072139 RepID=UPI00280ED237|nr:hypothetical protein [Sphingosinicella sp. LHD-64]MDQ8758130.1 hypothetical protein [Sphingosinicella sp. LHD-64]